MIPRSAEGQHFLQACAIGYFSPNCVSMRRHGKKVLGEKVGGEKAADEDDDDEQ